MKAGHTGIKRIVKASMFTWQGLKAAFRFEAAFRQEIFFSAVLIPIALWLDISSVEKVVLIGSILIVLIVELLNSAIEAVVDRISSERHELSGRAKDMGSAAVAMALALMFISWSLILFDHIGL